MSVESANYFRARHPGAFSDRSRIDTCLHTVLGSHLNDHAPACHENDFVRQESMNLDHIRERLQNGFQPFVMVTTDGRRFEVPHHDFIAVGKNVVVVLDEKDHSAKIDALHIVSIEDLAARKHK